MASPNDSILCFLALYKWCLFEFKFYVDLFPSAFKPFCYFLMFSVRIPRNCDRLELYLTRARSLFTAESTRFLANSRFPKFIPITSSFNPPIVTSFYVIFQRTCCVCPLLSLFIMLNALVVFPFFCKLALALPTTPSLLWDLQLQSSSS